MAAALCSISGNEGFRRSTESASNSATPIVTFLNQDSKEMFLTLKMFKLGKQTNVAHF
jgi:hypothetical protein